MRVINLGHGRRIMHFNLFILYKMSLCDTSTYVLKISCKECMMYKFMVIWSENTQNIPRMQYFRRKSCYQSKISKRNLIMYAINTCIYYNEEAKINFDQLRVTKNSWKYVFFKSKTLCNQKFPKWGKELGQILLLPVSLKCWFCCK